MRQAKVAIIGGTGVYAQGLLENEKTITTETRYGQVSLTQGSYLNQTIYFLARHGGGHSVPPHLVNYRANIAALKKLGVEAVIATAAVGTLNKSMPPGARIILDQFIDFTKNRVQTFFEGQGGEVVHTDFSEPYCFCLAEAIIKGAKHCGEKVISGGCYVCAEGPRFETPAEIKMYKMFGADLVGMTNVPEVTLAREAGLCYATIALATNYAAGISKTPLSHEEVLAEMEKGKTGLQKLLVSAASFVETQRSCHCHQAGVHWQAALHG